MRPCQTWQRAPEVGREESRETTTPPPRRGRIGPKVLRMHGFAAACPEDHRSQVNVSVEWERTDVAPGVRRRTVARTQFIIEGVEGPEWWGISTVVSVMGVHLA